MTHAFPDQNPFVWALVLKGAFKPKASPLLTRK